MEMQMSGNILLISLITYPSQRILRVRSSVCMVDFPPPLIHWTTSVPWTVYRRFLMRDQCVISFGLTQMIVVDGESLLGVLATPLGRILLPSLTTPMGLVLWLELTNLSWKVTIGVRKKMW
ncbi:hypothetical protein CK203_010865 [Vitis vinifera]|uniref:Uncharacterized protein n=1 Tax=Vitis vinifera TaxID=29760 RepID=A0A438JIN3_VITVI|nr:hypothetical protein CK203_010865 [Vitis vinifera]